MLYAKILRVWSIGVYGLLCLGIAVCPNEGRTQTESVKSAEVHSDGQVTFRLHAPEAQNVQVHWDSATESMKQGENGLWSVTVGPLQPDFYVYRFYVDGEGKTDPENSRVVINGRTSWSVLEVFGDQPLPQENRDVPHGTVHEQEMYSRILDDTRRFYVYTPPGYAALPDQKYPVLYLFHGGGQSEESWLQLGRANLILDNLIAASKVPPMLLVIPMVYGRRNPLIRPRTFDARAEVAHALEEFPGYMMDELRPFIAKHYRIDENRESQAIAGLSNGASHSRTIFMHHLDKFAYVGIWSGGGKQPSLDRDMEYLRANAGLLQRYPPKLVHVGRGKLETYNQEQMLTRIQSVFDVVFYAGVSGHDFRSWRSLLVDFATRLFRDEKK